MFGVIENNLRAENTPIAPVEPIRIDRKREVMAAMSKPASKAFPDKIKMTTIFTKLYDK
jgi:hypothetical protein